MLLLVVLMNLWTLVHYQGSDLGYSFIASFPHQLIHEYIWYVIPSCNFFIAGQQSLSTSSIQPPSSVSTDVNQSIGSIDLQTSATTDPSSSLVYHQPVTYQHYAGLSCCILAHIMRSMFILSFSGSDISQVVVLCVWV